MAIPFRSMEFEHPVFVQQNPNAAARPRAAGVPYYLKQTEAAEFDRAVADSMPELSHTRSYQVGIENIYIYIIVLISFISPMLPWPAESGANRRLACECKEINRSAKKRINPTPCRKFTAADLLCATFVKWKCTVFLWRFLHNPCSYSPIPFKSCQKKC